MYVYNGTEYHIREAACVALGEDCFELLLAGHDSTEAAHLVGASKRTARVWRNGHTRSNDRNEGARPVYHYSKFGIGTRGGGGISPSKYCQSRFCC